MQLLSVATIKTLHLQQLIGSFSVFFFFFFVSDESKMCQPGSETLPSETGAENPSVPAAAHRYKHPNTLKLPVLLCSTKLCSIKVEGFLNHGAFELIEVMSVCSGFIQVLVPYWRHMDDHSNRNLFDMRDRLCRTDLHYLKHFFCTLKKKNLK